MRASMHLKALCNAVLYRIERLHRLYTSSIELPPSERGVRLSYIAIELDNLNICALREFTVSTIRGAKTTNGTRITVNTKLGPDDEIGAYMLSIVNSVKYKRMKSPPKIKRTDEQAIRDPKEIEKILNSVGASNLSSLQNALALNSSLFRDLKFIRHFYAHRCLDTFSKVRASSATLGVGNPKHPDEVLSHTVSGRPYAILEEWLLEAKIFYQLLME